jgi:hypothetical protein
MLGKRLSVDVICDIVVRRTRKYVADFMFDPQNDIAWTTGITDSKPRQEGKLREGARVVRTAKFLGRAFDYEFAVVDADADTFVHMKVQKPFPMEIRYELEDVPEGTLVRIHTWGEPAGFFKLAGPMMAPKVRKNIGNDLSLLKKNLES